MATLLIVVFFLCLVLGLPIAFCLGLTSVVAVYMMDVPLRLIAQRMFTGMDSFPLMAVPFFVLAGDLMNVGGTTRGLINFANVLVGRIRGGLAHTNIVAVHVSGRDLGFRRGGCLGHRQHHGAGYGQGRLRKRVRCRSHGRRRRPWGPSSRPPSSWSSWG